MSASESRVVVVGAGVAGLLAARELRRRGLPVVVLEARRRIGGRIWTRRPRGVALPVELGATFVHGEAPVTRRLLRELAIADFEVEGRHVTLRDGVARSRDFWHGVDRLLGRVDRREKDVSFAEFLDSPRAARLPAEERAMAKAFVQGFHAAEVTEISLRSIAPREGESPSADAARAARIFGGYDLLPRFLARDLAGAVRLGNRVRRIAWRSGRAEVECQTPAGVESWRASAVVVTVPLGVLQAGALQIEPMPSRIATGIGQLAMGSAAIVSVGLREFPWQRRELLAEHLRRAAYLHTPGGSFNVWFTARPASWPLLVGWSGGPPSAELAKKGRRALLDTALAELARACGVRPATLRGNLVGMWAHDWDRDPFARGAYTYARVGGAEAGERIARPVEGTLFFAGEATMSDGTNGTVEGALASGLRAAGQVVRALQ